MMDAPQVPVAPAQALDPLPAQWRGFARRFVAVFIIELVAVFAFLVAVDPLDSGRFPKLTSGGPIDSVGRVVNVSRGHDPRFDAAIIGNSHLMPLEPKRLSAATGFSFVQLAVPAERKREDAAMIAWFRRNHPKIAAFVINADPTMCDRDPALPAHRALSVLALRLRSRLSVASDERLDASLWHPAHQGDLGTVGDIGPERSHL